jgi:LCP family protein required for cell wall assembly
VVFPGTDNGEPAVPAEAAEAAESAATEAAESAAAKGTDVAGPDVAEAADAAGPELAEVADVAGPEVAGAAAEPGDAVDPDEVPAPKRRRWVRRPVPSGDSDSDDGMRPPAKRKPPGRDPLWARLLVVFGAILVLAATGTIAATKVLASRVDSAVKKGTLIAPGARAGTGDVAYGSVTGPLNYLLIGSDARTDDPTAGARSDTIIIVHIPASLDRAYLISIPRDLRVQIPPMPSAGFYGAYEKINGAFDYGRGGEGGVQLLSATLSKLIGISFDGAAVIDFGGFEKVVKQLGGVNMCVDERTESQHIGHDKDGKFLAPWTGPDGSYRVQGSTPEVYEMGCRRMEPWQALDYARQRKSIPDGDYGRQRHQQQLLKAILDEARRQGVATSPRKVNSLIRSVGAALTVDTGGIPLADLVYGLRDINPGDLVGVKVPSEPQTLGGVAYVIAIEDRAASLYAALRSDDMANWVLDNQDWINGL